MTGASTVCFMWTARFSSRKILIAHELLHDYLDQSLGGRLSFSGYWRSSVQGWKRSLTLFTKPCMVVPLFVQSYLDLINRPSMETVFLESVFDFERERRMKERD
jgi:hypothetical protein